MIHPPLSRPSGRTRAKVLVLFVLLAATPFAHRPSSAAGAAVAEAPGLAHHCTAVAGDPIGSFWHHPVAAPIVDGFRPPSTPYGPGNRGLEYRTTGGDPVRAVADGVVGFAGPVGRSRFVVIQHPGGLRSTYAYLRGIDVEVGASVVRGRPIATAESGFHLTARRGAAYLDPLLLMADGCFIVRLVAVPPPEERFVIVE